MMKNMKNNQKLVTRILTNEYYLFFIHDMSFNPVTGFNMGYIRNIFYHLVDTG